MYFPKFSITPEINSQIAEIERIRTIVDRSYILPTKEIVLRQRMVIEATRSSTGIEGNPLSVQQVAMVLSGQKINASQQFITEVINYKKALNFIENRKKDSTPIVLKDILRIHKIVTTGLLPITKAGHVRKTPIYVVDIKASKEVIQYRGPDHTKVDSLLYDLLKWFNQDSPTLHPILKAGILHYEFVSIHPFADGNGRVARLLTLLYMYQSGYSFRGVLVPDTYYFSDRPRYYKALSRGKNYMVRRTADVTPWLSYFVEGFLSVSHDIQEKVTIAGISHGPRDLLTLSEDDYKVVDFLTVMKKVGIDDIVSAVKIPKRTIQRRLQYLTTNRLLRRLGRGRATRYILKVSG